jgi:hypothetical protein
VTVDSRPKGDWILHTTYNLIIGKQHEPAVCRAIVSRAPDDAELSFQSENS